MDNPGLSCWMTGVFGQAAVTSCSLLTDLHVINEAGVAPKALEVALAEVSETWGRVGLRLMWSFPPASPSTRDGRSVIVIIRRELSKLPASSAANAHGRVRRPLGWLVFGPDGQPGSLIEVSLAMITSLADSGSYLNFKVATLPDFARNPIIGRGLGRVVAHELGHWLMGRGHSNRGLMKAKFNAHDLTQLGLLQLPRAWMAADANVPGAVSAGCVPWALHRLK